MYQTQNTSSGKYIGICIYIHVHTLLLEEWTTHYVSNGYDIVTDTCNNTKSSLCRQCQVSVDSWYYHACITLPSKWV